MPGTPQGRNFVFTRFLTEQEDRYIRSDEAGKEQVPIIHDLLHVKYLIFQFEEGEKEHHAHLQGFVSLDSPRRTSWVKKMIGNNAHIELAHDVQGSIQYCSKTKGRIRGPWTMGKPPKGQGTRADIETMHEMIKKGLPTLDIIEKNPKLLRYEKLIKYDRFLQMEAHSDRQLSGVNVTCLWGDSGSGKTQWAINYLKHNTYFKLDCSGVKNGALWFDGYEGQDTLIIDDFDQDTCSINFLKLLLDKYKLRLPVKGEHTWACWKYVIITSNQHPADWWIHLPQVQQLALKRRIHEIMHCTEDHLYRRQRWDKTYIDEDFERIPDVPQILAPDTPISSSDSETQDLQMLIRDEQIDETPTRKRLRRTDSVDLARMLDEEENEFSC